MIVESPVPRIVQPAAYDIVRFSVKRLERSPYEARWASDDVLYATYANRLYPLSIGSDPMADYWTMRRAAVLLDVPEKPVLRDMHRILAIADHVSA